MAKGCPTRDRLGFTHYFPKRKALSFCLRHKASIETSAEIVGTSIGLLEELGTAVALRSSLALPPPSHRFRQTHAKVTGCRPTDPVVEYRSAAHYPLGVIGGARAGTEIEKVGSAG